MTYREFLNKLPDEDFADAIANNTIFNIACVHSNKFNTECLNSNLFSEHCIDCIVKLLKSEFEEPNI